MDQAASSDQGFFRDFDERSPDTIMDGDKRICSRGDHEEIFEYVAEHGRNPADFEFVSFRENPCFAAFGRFKKDSQRE